MGEVQITCTHTSYFAKGINTKYLLNVAICCTFITKFGFSIQSNLHRVGRYRRKRDSNKEKAV